MIDGNDFIVLASKWSLLAEAGEPTWRSATSRAYYGAFHCTRTFLFADLGVSELKSGSGKNVHAFVQNVIQKTGKVEAIKAGRLLGSLHEKRKDADYDIDDDACGTQQSSQHAHKTADEIRELIDLCAAKGNEEKAEMKEKIEKWKSINQI